MKTYKLHLEVNGRRGTWIAIGENVFEAKLKVETVIKQVLPDSKFKVWAEDDMTEVTK